jgi:hypothetical protein
VKQRHADVWRSKLAEAGESVATLAPSFRVRVVGWLAAATWRSRGGAAGYGLRQRVISLAARGTGGRDGR